MYMTEARLTDYLEALVAAETQHPRRVIITTIRKEFRKLNAKIERLGRNQKRFVVACDRVFDDTGWCPCCSSHRSEDADCLARDILNA